MDGKPLHHSRFIRDALRTIPTEPTRWFAALGAGTAALLVVAAGTTLPATSCGGSTEPESACDRVSVSLGATSARVGIRGCTSVDMSLRNINYYPNGDIQSFVFDVECTATSEGHSGRIYDIQYQDGLPVSFSKEVDGQTCR